MTRVTTQSSIAGQFRYTWSARTMAGSPGFGLSGVSSTLIDRLPWIESQPKGIRDLAPADQVDGDERRYRRYERVVIDEIALLVSKTYQGNTGDGRRGNYCVQVLVAPKESLTVSMAAAVIDDSFWIRPYSEADIASRDLADIDLPQHRLREAQGRGTQVLALMQDLTGHDWRHSWSAGEWAAALSGPTDPAGPAIAQHAADEGEGLDLLAELVAVLPEAADVDTSFAAEFDGAQWSVNLTVVASSEATTPNLGVRVAHGDATWESLRKLLVSQHNLDYIRTLVNLYHPAPMVRAPAKHLGIDALASAGPAASDQHPAEVEDFLHGDGQILRDRLERPDGDPVLLCRGLVEYLSSRCLRLNCASPTTTWISGLVVGHCEGAFEAAVLDSVMPQDDDQIRALVAKVLSPATLRAVVTTSGRARLVPESVAGIERLWPTLRTVAGTDDQWRQLCVLVGVGAGSEHSFLASLLSAEPVDVELLFERLIPEAVGDTDEALSLLLGPALALFCRWRSVPDFYTQVLVRGRRRATWFASILSRRSRL